MKLEAQNHTLGFIKRSMASNAKPGKGMCFVMPKNIGLTGNNQKQEKHGRQAGGARAALQSRRGPVEGAARLRCRAGAGAGAGQARAGPGLADPALGQGQLVIEQKALCLPCQYCLCTSNLCLRSVVAPGSVLENSICNRGL